MSGLDRTKRAIRVPTYAEGHRMPNYHRRYVAGGTYFFTVVTHSRRPFLTTNPARELLENVIEDERQKASFELVASVILPDHLHMIWTLPPEDDRYSVRWMRIKEKFTRKYLAAGGSESKQFEGKLRKRERGIWQSRFWEHTVRDEDDFKRCLDYIHWNPVKHGCVTRPCDYPWSTFQQFVELGEYDPLWGTGIVIDDVAGAEWE